MRASIMWLDTTVGCQQVPWGPLVTPEPFVVLLTIENCGSKLEKVSFTRISRIYIELAFYFPFEALGFQKLFLKNFFSFYIPWCNCGIWKDIPVLLLNFQKVSFFSSLIWSAYSTSKSFSSITGLVCQYKILLASTICQVFCSKNTWNQNTSRGRNRFVSG